jgi:hypothetical protein
MSELVMIAYPTEAKPEDERQKLLAMQKDYLIELGDAVIAVKDPGGRIKLNQLLNTTATGAVSGAFWGTFDRANLPDAVGGRRARCGVRRRGWCADRCRHQR